MIYRRSYEEPIVDSSGNLLSAIAVRSRRTCVMMKPFSFSLSSSSSRSILLSLSSRLRSSDRHESAAISGSGSLAFRCLFAVPIAPTAFCDREHRAASTPISGSEESDEMPLLKIRRQDPNSMQLLPARYLGEGGSRECAAAHYNAWRRSSLSMSRHSARRRSTLRRRVKR